MKLSISIGNLTAFANGLREAPEFTRQVLVSTMTEATLLIEREWKENLPRVSGLTAQSITSDVFSSPAGVLGVTGSSQPSALFIELGTKAHMPPIEALVPWVKAALGIVDPKEVRNVAFLVARKIARTGTKAQRPAGRAVEAVEGQVVAMFERAAGQISERLLRGGVA